MTGPYDINLIADYVIQVLNTDEQQEVALSNLKLQKLLYYIQAWSLGIKREALIDSEFEAWVHGPVSRKLYKRFSSTKTLYSQISRSDIISREGSFDQIAEEDKGFIKYILENYAGFSGVELETMTHQEDPWKEAREGLRPMETGSNILSRESMQTYYGNRWNGIKNG